MPFTPSLQSRIQSRTRHGVWCSLFGSLSVFCSQTVSLSQWCREETHPLSCRKYQLLNLPDCDDSRPSVQFRFSPSDKKRKLHVRVLTFERFFQCHQILETARSRDFPSFVIIDQNNISPSKCLHEAWFFPFNLLFWFWGKEPVLEVDL